MRLMRLGKTTIFVVLAFLLLIGCSGSKEMTKDGDNSTSNISGQDDYDEIEKLLGISENEKTEKTDNTDNGDDLLQLLEADEGNKPKSESEVEKPAANETDLTELVPEVSKAVNDKLKKKDMEIADLKAQLMMSKEELKKYKSGKSTSSQSFSSEKSGFGFTANALGGDDYVNEYQRGIDAFHNREYRNAIAVFEGLLSQSASHNYADNAQYWIGESYYALAMYREAIMAFEKVFTFTFSNKNDYAQFKIGQCYFKLGDKQKARQEFQSLIDNYDRIELVERARDYLAQL